DERPGAAQVGDGDVGRVAVFAEGHDELRRRLVARGLEEGVEGDVLPAGIELGPLGDAVDVDGLLGGRQRVQRLPGPAAELAPRRVLERERPPVERDARRRPSREDRELVSDVLPGRDALRVAAPALTTKAAGDHVALWMLVRAGPSRRRELL